MKQFCVFYDVLWFKKENDSNKNETTEKGSTEYDTEKEAADGSEKDADSNLSNHSSPNKPGLGANETDKEDASKDADKSDSEDNSKPNIKP